MATRKDITFIAGINTPDGRGNATVYVGYRDARCDQAGPARLQRLCARLVRRGDPAPFSCGGSSTSARRSLPPHPADPATSSRRRLHDRRGQPAARLRGHRSVQLRAGQLLSASGRAQDRRPVRALRLQREGQRLHRVHVHGRPHARRRSRRAARSSAAVPGQPPFFGDQRSTATTRCSRPTSCRLRAAAAIPARATSCSTSAGATSKAAVASTICVTPRSAASIGLRGDIADGWNYDVYGLYGTSILSENFQNDMSRQRVGKALNAVVDTRPARDTGQTVCRVNADVDLSNDDPACVP